MKQELKFIAYTPMIRQLKTDKGWVVSFDVSQTDYNVIKELPNYQETQLEISVKVRGEEE